MKKYLLAIVTCLLTASLSAVAYQPARYNPDPVSIPAIEREPVESVETAQPEIIIEEQVRVPSRQMQVYTGELSPEIYDSLVSQWYERNVLSSYDSFFQDFINIDTTIVLHSEIPDSVYMARLQMIVSPINMSYNDVVKRHIQVYTGSRRGTMGRILGLSQYYFPMIEEELERNGLPLELRILPVIESALNPVAVSKAGATGLWQFMYRTGKSYGLEVTSFVDDRRDPLAATKAACRFLGDLYNMYGDWTLAIAAYNCGPGNVNKAIKRAGGTVTDFWDIYNYLPRETRGYIPGFIAATYAYHFHSLHGIEMVSPPLPLAVDTIMVNRLMHFEQISTTIGIPVETLRALNPQYKVDIIPASAEKRYPLTIPQYDMTRYLAHEEIIHAKDSVYLADYFRNGKPPGESTAPLNASVTTYKVKSGDTLGAIARNHGVTVSQLMRWNNITNAHKLRIGQSIEIHR